MNDGKDDTTHLYAWLARDEEGIEGVIAAPNPVDGSAWPLVVTSIATARRFAPIALEAARRRDTTARLVRFIREETLEELP